MKKIRKNMKILIIKCCQIGILSLLVSANAFANNVSVTNVTLTEQNTSAETCKVEFDIAWDNSWRHAINYDAVWVFIKYSTDSGVTWNHATLASFGLDPPGFSTGTGTGLEILVDQYGQEGAFLRRDAYGTGSVDTDDIQFVWDWNADGLSAGDTARVWVFAIEMVYIPEGTLYLNTTAGVSTSNEFFDDGGSTVQITSEGSLSEGAIRWEKDFTFGGQGNDNGTSYGSDALGADYPKGYGAFYLMKYEISQGQYRDFLNTLTRTQQNARTQTDVSTDAITNVYVMANASSVTYRQGIRCPASGNGTTDPITFGCDLDGDGTFDEENDGEWITCNYLSWPDLIAYADWAGLRPMTELEFEKACRGNQAVVMDEHAWGTTNATAFSSLSNAGYSNEASGTAGANANYSNCSPNGPVRCGLFATATSSREQSGAGYYGNMELSGNVVERCVTIADKDNNNNTTDAGLFDGTHGNGALDTAGDANVSTWPGTDSLGSGFRGESWLYGEGAMRVADRTMAGYTYAARDSHYGGRCARTEPTLGVGP